MENIPWFKKAELHFIAHPCSGIVPTGDQDVEDVCSGGLEYFEACTWCHGICLESRYNERFHHENQCDSNCGKHYDCTYFERCSLNRELE